MSGCGQSDGVPFFILVCLSLSLCGLYISRTIHLIIKAPAYLAGLSLRTYMQCWIWCSLHCNAFKMNAFGINSEPPFCSDQQQFGAGVSSS